MLQRPLDLTFRNMTSTPALEAAVHEGAAKLEAVSKHLLRCRVVVELPHRSQLHGKHVHVTIDVSGPGQVLIIRRDPQQHQENEDAYVAIHDAFASARRKLLDWEHKHDGKVARHRAARA